MNHITNQSKVTQCLCCHPLTARRHFLKSLLPAAVAFGILQSTAPAKAETHQPQALVLSCIDFRFLTAERYFLRNKHLLGEYDWTALAGASLAITGFPHPSDAEAFWDQLDISYRLHHIQKVIVIDHQDCGAYAMMIDPNLSKDPERELQVHTDYLNRAYWLIRNRYPDIDVELYLATLNQDEFKTILPRLENQT
ncbi:carbonic anhydrase [Sphaerospermopsis aphanizomenoides BCCUSP55]|uniref:carbonic anhydrase n=1 Tax=Sphaerospermopsis aphanizomenoides TaxID=459663 RepID=UPI001905FDBE|nr:carbonic anhydrase [Sphaerospermopsis aphanizomenoides]MBK1986277.1 carbonic anhydrase [Sphaerospermopsis aphanizomenoides BCCUSP55]